MRRAADGTVVIPGHRGTIYGIWPTFRDCNWPRTEGPRMNAGPAGLRTAVAGIVADDERGAAQRQVGDLKVAEDRADVVPVGLDANLWRSR